MSLIRSAYHKLIPQEHRFWLYKLRNKASMEQLKVQENRHHKAVFSLKGYTEREAIFVHITKAAGTSVALSLFGYLPYHYTAWQYRVIFGRKAFDHYFKFTFVRNPWDRLYSAYNYLKNGGWDENDRLWAEKHWADIATFEQFVLEWLTPERLDAHLHLRPQHYFLLDWRGKVLVDYLGYFETIDDDFSIIAAKVNPNASLTHTNASPRGGYQEAYSDQARDKVGRLYKRDIDLFGYEFEGVHRKTVVNRRLVSHAPE